MGAVLLDEVTKCFGNGTVAVDAVTLQVEDGEFVVLVGPSGCGKTTLLRMIAGLERPTAGRIRIGERDVTHLAPRDRDIAMVFQDYALYPHMTVAENLGFGLKLRKVPKKESRTRVSDAAKMLGLDQLLARRPAQLSGGQRQRVAMGRAMVREPQAFLLDEPLSNLDAKLRIQMRTELARLRDRLRTSTVYVTHDQIEAMTLGDRVAVMCDGRLQQLDTPAALFRHPANLFVASFIGSPSMNFVKARVGKGRIEFGGFELPAGHIEGLGGNEGRALIVGIRPSSFEDLAFVAGQVPFSIDVIADVVEELGDEVQVTFTVDEPPVLTDQVRAAAVAEGDAEEEGRALLLFDEHKDRCSFTVRVNPSTDASPGKPLRLAVDLTQIYLFDPDTGAALDLPGPRGSFPERLGRRQAAATTGSKE